MQDTATDHASIVFTNLDIDGDGALTEKELRVAWRMKNWWILLVRQNMRQCNHEKEKNCKFVGKLT